MRRKAIILSATVVLSIGLFTSQSGQADPVPPVSGEQVRALAGVQAAGPKTTHAAPVVDGGVWTFQSFANGLGEFCFSRDVPSEGTGITCLSKRAQLFTGREVFAIHGARVISSPVRELEWDNMWVQGFVSPTVASLEVVNMDCSKTSIAFDADGAFLHVVSSEKIRRDQVPYRLIARSVTGAVVHEQDVDAGITPNASRAGLAAPKPRAACA